MKPFAALGTAALIVSPVAGQPPPHLALFPPVTVGPRAVLRVGETLTMGGPGAANFLPNAWTAVHLVPHQAVWRDGDPLGRPVGRVWSDAKGTLRRTNVWVADRDGPFDIGVDYDGDGQFSYALDALEAVVVRPPLPPATPEEK